jgi:uncharacterized protein YbjQ (UPF0145 family)
LTADFNIKFASKKFLFVHKPYEGNETVDGLKDYFGGELMVEKLILATMPIIPKYEVEEVLGVIYGSSTRTRGAGGRLISGIQALTGGKGTAYAEEIEKARKEALEDLKNEAKKLGANGVLSIDFETAEILEGFILVTAYGTAVKLKK